MSVSQQKPSVESWFKHKGWKPAAFQRQTWKAYQEGQSGLVNAPTGSGKTYALWGAIVQESLAVDAKPKGLQAIWITPLRALAVEIQQTTHKMTQELLPEMEVQKRTGDSTAKEKAAFKSKLPFGLVTTPESLHLLLSHKKNEVYFKNLQCIVVDEWHELMGSKRGVQVELALAYLCALFPKLRVWGISATLGNLELAQQILLQPTGQKGICIRANTLKKIRVQSLIPQTMETFPWRGHLGLHLLPEVLKQINKNRSTLVFTNTRAQCEIWYQKILEAAPQLAGEIAMHHGSMEKKVRLWVENQLREDKLKLVVCTSSLDLGVDFSPVESCIQIGSPKGVGRFLQRAGRSGHRPGATSTIHFVPTHAMELIEALALQKAIDHQAIEDRQPYLLSFDVLIQFLMTLAVGNGFHPKDLFTTLQKTFCFQEMRKEEWHWCLNFIRYGSQSLEHYDEYKKVEVSPDGNFQVLNKGIAMRHRMSMGTIVGGADLKIKYLKGGYLGTIEEWFISKLQPGDTFTFSGRILELVRIQNMEVLVRKSKAKKAKVPSWMGGRMSFSAHLSQMLRETLYDIEQNDSPEKQALEGVLQQQKKQSIIPQPHEFLIESFNSREGYHAIFYPFEGRAVHEAMASIVAYRLGLLEPQSFSLAFNDYGFELLSDRPVDIQGLLDNNLLNPQDIFEDLRQSFNVSEMARRKFRDIAVIGGLVFQGFPNKPIKTKHLQSGTQLFYEVFKDYEPDNLLYLQALTETYEHGMEEGRLQQAFERIETQELCWLQTNHPTPFSFPIITDRLRGKLSSEKVEDRIKRMLQQLNKATQI